MQMRTPQITPANAIRWDLSQGTSTWAHWFGISAFWFLTFSLSDTISRVPWNAEWSDWFGAMGVGAERWGYNRFSHRFSSLATGLYSVSWRTVGCSSKMSSARHAPPLCNEYRERLQPQPHLRQHQVNRKQYQVKTPTDQANNEEP